MTLSQSLVIYRPFFTNELKTFLTWIFTLTICGLVVGFPAVALTVIGGALIAMCLQVFLSTSAILVVVVSILALNGLLITVAAALLTSWNFKPHQVSFLSWLYPPKQRPLTPFASCPLTCAVTRYA